MTEDILFDNIYIGHSVEDAKALAAETFEVKKPLENAAAKPETAADEDVSETTFKDSPIDFIRQKVLTFVDLAKLDPLLAFKTYPDTAVGLAIAVFTLFGALFGLIGSQQKPVITKVRCFSLQP